MKKFLFIIPIIFLFSCKPIVTDDPIIKNPSATVTVTSIEQQPLSDYLTINYTITNTGNCYIDYYKVNFAIICLGAPVTFHDWDNGTGVSIGESRQDSLFTYVAGYPYYGCVPGIDELDSY